MISKEQVEKIAKLVKIDLTEAEKTKFAKMFSETLEYVEILKELETENIEETYQVNGLTNVFQTPENKATLPSSEVVKNAANVKKGLFVTEGVFDRE